jgi:cyclic lactone autoinducer peptide
MERLEQMVVKKAASFARNIAKDSAEARCFMLLHEPKKPENLEGRLKNLVRN